VDDGREGKGKAQPKAPNTLNRPCRKKTVFAVSRCTNNPS